MDSQWNLENAHSLGPKHAQMSTPPADEYIVSMACSESLVRVRPEAREERVARWRHRPKKLPEMEKAWKKAWFSLILGEHSGSVGAEVTAIRWLFCLRKATRYISLFIFSEKSRSLAAEARNHLCGWGRKHDTQSAVFVGAKSTFIL